MRCDLRHLTPGPPNWTNWSQKRSKPRATETFNRSKSGSTTSLENARRWMTRPSISTARSCAPSPSATTGPKNTAASGSVKGVRNLAVVREQVPIAVQGQRGCLVAQQGLQHLHIAPPLMASEAQVCRNSCGVTTGNSESARGPSALSPAGARPSLWP
jgi:hypothetical protein